MKKICIISYIFCIFSAAAFAADEKDAVYLDFDEPAKSVSVQKGRIDMTQADVTYKQDIREKQIDNFLYNNGSSRKSAGAVSKGIEKNVLKDTVLGASYSAAEKSGKLDDSVSMYSKYKKERFGVTAGYSLDRKGYKEDGALGGTFSVSPEFSVNRHVKLKNTFSQNFSSNVQKGGAAVSVSPLKDDRLNLDLGVSETFSSGNESAKSQINFGAEFKF